MEGGKGAMGKEGKGNGKGREWRGGGRRRERRGGKEREGEGTEMEGTGIGGRKSASWSLGGWTPLASLKSSLVTKISGKFLESFRKFSENFRKVTGNFPSTFFVFLHIYEAYLSTAYKKTLSLSNPWGFYACVRQSEV
jgi:hypothetical protein